MEVADEEPKLLTNVEVLEFIKEQRKELKKVKKKATKENLNTIIYETHRYLEKMSGSEAAAGAGGGGEQQSLVEDVKNFLAELKGSGVKLQSKEVLQLINHRASQPVLMQLLIDLTDDIYRISDEDAAVVERLLKKYFPTSDDGNKEDEEDSGSDENVASGS